MPQQMAGESGTETDRPIPYPLEKPEQYTNAIKKGTRTESGAPGDSYWINSASYVINAKLYPAEKRVEATETVQYTNNSPDTLRSIGVNLNLNWHKEGAIRNEMAEVTGGMPLSLVKFNGKELTDTLKQGPRYRLNGTYMVIITGEPIAPGATVNLEFAWKFKVPKEGASGRMGWSKDNLFYFAYFYPQVAVYDDVIGWHLDQFQGTAEFYADFADYDVTIEVPGDWLVIGTGELTNAKNVLAEPVYNRMLEGHASDSVVHVVTEADFGAAATTGSEKDWLRWNFKSKKVRDVAFSITKESNWDAARANVGDLDGDGKDDYSAINTIWRSEAFRWAKAWDYARHSIEFLSKYTTLKYQWPHMTAVEGSGIIGGGMEFPMMTIIGDYSRSNDRGLYSVVAHELAHMWVPLTVNNNERRYAWMDEGTTSFNENQAAREYFDDPNSDQGDLRGYLYAARMGIEGEILRWSDYHYNGFAYGTASYSKPSTNLRTLRNLLGEEVFNKAYHEYLNRWKYKHPYPWDMFATFNDVSGKNLDWFWTSWYAETWTLDHAVASVVAGKDGTVITIEDKGDAVMPTWFTVHFADGTSEEKQISEKTWLTGVRSKSVTIPAGKTVTKVEIDPKGLFPDIDTKNNTWQK
ncbi:M1 family peptidase [bacterium]|nr:MAG: M1 family peptidase [bacterium]